MEKRPANYGRDCSTGTLPTKLLSGTGLATESEGGSGVDSEELKRFFPHGRMNKGAIQEGRKYGQTLGGVSSRQSFSN